MSLCTCDLFFFDDNVYAKLLRKETISIPEAIDFFNTKLTKEDECEFFLEFFHNEMTPTIINANMNFFTAIFDDVYRFQLHGLLNEKYIFELSYDKIKLICDFKHIEPKLSSIEKVFTNPNKFKFMFTKWWSDSESIKEVQLKLKLFFISDINNSSYIEINSFVRKYRYDMIVKKKLFFEDMMNESLKNHVSRRDHTQKSQRREIIMHHLKKSNTFDSLMDEFRDLKV